MMELCTELKTGKRGQKTELTGRSPRGSRRSALDYTAILEEEGEEEEEDVEEEEGGGGGRRGGREGERGL